MEQEIKIEQSEDLAYWVGLMQTDGCIYKRKECKSWVISFTIGTKSLPMLEKFKLLTKSMFGIDGKITKKSEGIWQYRVTVTKLLEVFRELGIKFGDPPKPPIWCQSSSETTGSYLAAVIDGDGDIRVKRPKYPQCVIRIHSGREQQDLIKSIEEILKCSISVTPRYRVVEYKGRIIKGLCFDLEFYVSSKSEDFIKTYVLPKMTIKHKVQKLSEFLSNN